MMSNVGKPGLLVVLVDESAGMNALMGEVVSDGSASTKTNLERVATAVNSWLNQLAAGNDLDIALVGYQTDNAGQVQVGCRWGGSLAGREWIATSELAQAPLRVETRTRKVPAPGGFGVAREEQVSFPVWYSPIAGVKAPQIAAYNFCTDLVTRWAASTGGQPVPSLVVHISAGASGDGNPQMAVRKLMEIGKPVGSPLVFQAHVATSAAVTAALYPSNVMFLTSPASRDLFQRSSPLPAEAVQRLKDDKIVVNAGARGVIHNGKIGDLIRFLAMVRHYVQTWPSRGAAAAPAASAATAPVDTVAVAAPIEPKPAETIVAADVPVSAAASGAATDPSRLVVLVLDRSVQDPYGGDIANACVRLQDAANETLKLLSRAKVDALDVGIVSYGADSSGAAEVRSTFDGPLSGRAIVNRSELAGGAIRVEEFEEQVSNGVGGLVSITRKKPVYFDIEATAAGGLNEAMAAAAALVGDWRRDHAGAAAPIVLHFTRAAFTDGVFESAVGSLASDSAPSLYHLVATEQPHPAVAYPSSDADLADDGLKRLWQLTARLLHSDRLGASRPAINADSRGLVVNGKFDVLIELLEAAVI